MIPDAWLMRFQALESLHDVAYWNQQAEHVLVMGIPRRWRDVDAGTLARLSADAAVPILAAVACPRFDGRAHRVVVFTAGTFTPQQVRSVLDNPGALVGQREPELGRLEEGPIPVLVDRERGFLAHYRLGRPLSYDDGTADAGSHTETIVWHRGVAYGFALTGPAANHPGYVPFYYSMLATVRWTRR